MTATQQWPIQTAWGQMDAVDPLPGHTRQIALDPALPYRAVYCVFHCRSQTGTMNNTANGQSRLEFRYDGNIVACLRLDFSTNSTIICPFNGFSPGTFAFHTSNIITDEDGIKWTTQGGRIYLPSAAHPLFVEADSVRWICENHSLTSFATNGIIFACAVKSSIQPFD